MEPGNRPHHAFEPHFELASSNPTRQRLRVGLFGDGKLADEVLGLFASPLCAALRRRGVAIVRGNTERPDWSQFDCLHLLGTSPRLHRLQRAASARDIPTVVTPADWLAPFWLQGQLSPAERLAIWGEWALRRLPVPGISTAGRMMRRATVVAVFSQVESQRLRQRFSLPWRRLMVLPPPVLPPVPLPPDELPFHVQYGISGYVMCLLPPGAREYRRLLQAMLGTRVPLLVIAPTTSGRRRRMRREMQSLGPLVTVVPPEQLSEPMLESALDGAGAMVILRRGARDEHWAFRAMAHGVPVVAPKDGIAAEYGGDYVRPFASMTAPGFRRIVLETWQAGRRRCEVPLPCDPELHGCNAVDAFCMLYRRATLARSNATGPTAAIAQ